jgi:hypothetical protein
MGWPRRPLRRRTADGFFAARFCWRSSTFAALGAQASMGIPGSTSDPLHLTFQGVKAGTYMPGNGCPDGIHYDVKGNLWIAAGRLGGIVEIDPRGLILGFVPIPNGDLATTNFAFGGPGRPGRRALARATVTAARRQGRWPLLV